MSQILGNQDLHKWHFSLKQPYMKSPSLSLDIHNNVCVWLLHVAQSSHLE